MVHRFRPLWLCFEEAMTKRLHRNRYQAWLLRHPFAMWTWRVLLTLVGHVVFFWMRPRITKATISECYRRLRSGDAIGVYSRRFPTGLFLPKGEYGVEHSAIYIGCGLVVEAVTPRVRVIPLRHFLRSYDRVVIARMGFCPDDLVVVRNKALSLAGRRFPPGALHCYCHETCATAIDFVRHVEKSGEFWLFDDIAAVAQSVEEVEE
jgi:hypothetical protein